MTAVALTALLFWASIFTIFFVADGRTPLELLLGRYEPPPDALGMWKEAPGDPSDPGAALVREERFVLPGARRGAGYFLHQVRYRDPVTRGIVRVEPERRVPRRRVRG